MSASIPVPPRFAAQPLVPCPVPQTLTALLAARGIDAGQRVFKVFTDEERVRVGLAQEFQGALGYAFDWGWVLPVPSANDDAPGELAHRNVLELAVLDRVHH